MATDFQYREHTPIAPLRPYVQCLWTLAGTCEEPSPQRVLPDGSMSLVLSFGAPVEQVHETGAVRRPPTFVIGEVRRPIEIQSRGRFELLGVRVRPGAIRAFVETPVAAIVDEVTDDTPLATPLARAIARTVYGADPADRLRLLQRALLAQVADAPPASVQAAVAALVRADGLVPIDRLAAMSAVTRRSLERRFLAEVGIAPKALASVLRFRRVLRAIEDPRADWVQVSLDCGYYDQSHLIRDFKRFTGSTPSAYGAEALALARVSRDPDDVAFVQDRAVGE